MVGAASGVEDHLDAAVGFRLEHFVGLGGLLQWHVVGGEVVDAEGVVVKTVRMPRYRLGLPVPKARLVIEASAGAFSRWNLSVGDVVEVRDR